MEKQNLPTSILFILVAVGTSLDKNHIPRNRARVSLCVKCPQISVGMEILVM